MNILDLPETVLLLIFDYVSYAEIAKNREVCQRFNLLGQEALNFGYKRVVQVHRKNYKRIKALLPRRESERNGHYLSRYIDVLNCVDTRLSMLSITFSKYIENGFCCFIPGRVLDELYKIIRITSSCNKHLRPHDVVQELRDQSSMAIEHFDEHIVDTFKEDYLSKITGRARSLSGLSEMRFSGLASTTTAMMQGLNKLLALTQMQRCSGSNGAVIQLQRLPAENIVLQQDNEVQQQELQQQQQVLLQQQQPPQQQPETPKRTKNTLKSLKRLEHKYKSTVNKMRSMQQTQLRQARQIRTMNSAIAELTAQVSKLKKHFKNDKTKCERRVTTSVMSYNTDATPSSTTSVPKRHAAIEETFSGAEDSSSPQSLSIRRDLRKKRKI